MSTAFGKGKRKCASRLQIVLPDHRIGFAERHGRSSKIARISSEPHRSRFLFRLLGVRWRVSAPCIWRKKIMPRKKKMPRKKESAPERTAALRQETLIELASDRRRREDNFNACNA